MRAIFGVLGLLITLAIVGVLAVKQLRATGQVSAALPPATAGASAATVREQSQQIQQKVQSDITKALEQGAAARKDEAGQ
jgi:hypothetical protein